MTSTANSRWAWSWSSTGSGSGPSGGGADLQLDTPSKGQLQVAGRFLDVDVNPDRPAPRQFLPGYHPGAMEPEGPRQVIGLVFHGIRAEFDRRGLTERVLE